MNQMINLTHLKFFCDAVMCNSISEAAKKNYVSQPAVSQAISKIEMILGGQLVIHNRQKFQLTEIGSIVFDQAGHIFKSVECIYDKINQKKGAVSGVLKFVTTRSLGMSLLPMIYKQAEINLPDVKLSFQLGNLNFIRNALRQHEAEFAIVVYDKDFAQYSTQLLQTGQFNLYQSIDASPNLIEKGIMVDYFKGTHVSDLQDHFARARNPLLKIKTEMSSWDTVARFTESNIAVGFFPDYLVANSRFPTIQPYPIEIPPFEYQICAIYNKENPLSKIAKAFLDQFKTGDKSCN